MSTDLVRLALNGPTMGTRWTALFFARTDADCALEPIRTALAACVGEVDRQMSTWTPASDLMRLNRAAPMDWVTLPAPLMEVLARALDIGHQSQGAFDIGLGDAVTAWGFGSEAACPTRIKAALAQRRQPAHAVLELDPAAMRARKRAPLTLDLSGIAKGFAVDRMMAVLNRFGVDDALVGLDGELRAQGLRPDGTPWTVAVERPDTASRAPLAMLALHNAAVATSGDYRHRIAVGGRHLAHTIDPQRGAPLNTSPASVTVVMARCMDADAWATALMVQGSVAGAETARTRGLDALFIDHDGDALVQTGVGPLFAADPVPQAVSRPAQPESALR